ncbi:hypothetical protein BDF14DRAFT_1886566 [Spinellus fusiger]|nr:hypothetical protein BDF14DRAFT_1886566 [Spinellus fusiger]
MYVCTVRRPQATPPTTCEKPVNKKPSLLSVISRSSAAVSHSKPNKASSFSEQGSTKKTHSIISSLKKVPLFRAKPNPHPSVSTESTASTSHTHPRPETHISPPYLPSLPSSPSPSLSYRKDTSPTVLELMKDLALEQWQVSLICAIDTSVEKEEIGKEERESVNTFESTLYKAPHLSLAKSKAPESATMEDPFPFNASKPIVYCRPVSQRAAAHPYPTPSTTSNTPRYPSTSTTHTTFGTFTVQGLSDVPEASPIVFTKQTTLPKEGKDSLLSAQLRNVQSQAQLLGTGKMTTKAKLEAAAVRRKMIKFGHMQEQANDAWWETLQLKSGCKDWTVAGTMTETPFDRRYLDSPAILHEPIHTTKDVLIW